jgi:hypothetical protein
VQQEGIDGQLAKVAVGGNAIHGKRRTNQDKRRAVMTLLEDDEWKAWSNHEIARDSPRLREIRRLALSDWHGLCSTAFEARLRNESSSED